MINIRDLFIMGYFTRFGQSQNAVPKQILHFAFAQQYTTNYTGL